VQRALSVAVALGVLSTLAIIGQAVALASLLGSLFHDAHAGLFHGVVLFSAATLLRAVAVGLGEPVTSRIASPIRRDLRRRALRQVLASGPMSSVDATVQLCTRGVDAIETYIAKYVPSLVLSVLAPVILLCWLSWHDLLSAVIVLVSVALLPVFMILLGLEAKEKMDQRWHEQQELAGYFGDVVRGMTVLKSFNRSGDAVKNLDDVGDALQRTTMGTLRVAFLSSFALELLSSLATALVALVLGLRLLNGSLALSTALAVLLLTPEVFLPLRRSAAQFHGSADGIAAATELLSALETPQRRGDNEPPDAPPSIELRGVKVGHSLRASGLADTINATIEAGSLVSIVGPSGSGKTTLLRVLAGLRDAQSGAVLVNGVDLASIGLSAWHDRVAWLPQDPTLPGDTVRGVVQMGDVRIGELSAGERRRLALVRCIVRKPLVLLLDEPTAHLDAENAELVASAISELSMTRVVATHRPFVVDQCISLTEREVPSER
jgi:ATP-binding cassette subfamily C protein CydCD